MLQQFILKIIYNNLSYIASRRVQPYVNSLNGIIYIIYIIWFSCLVTHTCTQNTYTIWPMYTNQPHSHTPIHSYRRTYAHKNMYILCMRVCTTIMNTFVRVDIYVILMYTINKKNIGWHYILILISEVQELSQYI